MAPSLARVGRLALFIAPSSLADAQGKRTATKKPKPLQRQRPPSCRRQGFPNHDRSKNPWSSTGRTKAPELTGRDSCCRCLRGQIDSACQHRWYCLKPEVREVTPPAAKLRRFEPMRRRDDQTDRVFAG